MSKERRKALQRSQGEVPDVVFIGGNHLCIVYVYVYVYVYMCMICVCVYVYVCVCVCVYAPYFIAAFRVLF